MAFGATHVLILAVSCCLGNKGDCVKTSVIDVTPEMALDWLTGNVHNRPLRPTIIKKYTSLMKANKWRLTHQGIAFADEETINQDGEKKEILIDGQHRLMAIYESGMTIRMQVTRDLPMNTQLAVDDHGKRSVIDVGCVYRGLKDDLTKRHVAAARLIWLFGLGMPKDMMSNEQMVMFVKKYLDGIDFAVRQVFQGRAKTGVTQAGVLAIVAQAFYAGAQQSRLLEFGEVMLTGDKKSDRDQAAITLREWLRDRSYRTGHAADQLAIYQKTQRALLSFLQGQRLDKLYASTEQLFPMPGSEKPLKKKRAQA